MTKKRILFVDDEPNILAGLRLRLRRQRERWEMSFAGSGEEALGLLAASPFDVIVTDMRMPGMDGAMLLGRVQELYPNVIRIVLSGHSEFEAALRAVPVAHQFLAKPCEENLLESVVDRACNLQQLINDEAVRKVVAGIDKLPTMPKTHARLRFLLRNQRASMHDVAAVIRQDAAICAKLLQMVNSAFFRLSRTISSIEEATTYLGLDTLQKVLLAAELFSAPPKAVAGVSIQDLQRHALVTASIASRLLPAGQQQEDAYVAAMLHDVGKLVLATYLHEHLEQPLTESARTGETLHSTEIRIFGVSHAEVGAYLLGIWGLPYFVVEAVANHHAPSRVEQAGFGVLAAVHVANALAHVLGSGRPEEPDFAYLASLGVDKQWDNWKRKFRDDVARWAAVDLG